MQNQVKLDSRFRQLDPEEVMEAFCELYDSRDPLMKAPFHVVKAFATQDGPVSVVLVMTD